MICAASPFFAGMHAVRKRPRPFPQNPTCSDEVNDVQRYRIILLLPVLVLLIGLACSASALDFLGQPTATTAPVQPPPDFSAPIPQPPARLPTLPTVDYLPILVSVLVTVTVVVAVMGIVLWRRYRKPHRHR
jgi:hypothetical protein